MREGLSAAFYDQWSTGRETPSSAWLSRTFELAHEGETFDREWYPREVLPGLASISTTAIARATGMSTSSASKIRAGKRVPHPMWWEALDSLRESH
jgi:hypothetical protein